MTAALLTFVKFFSKGKRTDPIHHRFNWLTIYKKEVNYLFIFEKGGGGMNELAIPILG